MATICILKYDKRTPYKEEEHPETLWEISGRSQVHWEETTKHHKVNLAAK
jgi:hypothetical protein